MIKRIIEYLNRFFNINKQDIKETINVDKVDVPKVVEMPKEFVKLEFGDIIMAQRYDNLREQNMLGEDHQNGPFIVIGKDEDKLIGVYCSSSPNRQGKRLLENKYTALNKDTYFSMRRIKTIDKDQFLCSTGKRLYGKDMERLKKALYFNPQISYVDKDSKKTYVLNEEMKLSKGDIIISNHKLLLILGETEDNFEVIRVYNPIVKTNSLNFAIQDFDFSKIETKNKNDKYSFVMTINQKQMDIIDYKRSKYKPNELPKTLDYIDVGYLIRKNGSLCYVYSIDGDIAHAFRCGYIENEETLSFKINNHIIRPHFKRIIDINRFDKNIKIEEIATQEEMHIIKQKRKSYLKSCKQREEIKQRKMPIKSVFDVGNVIKSNNMPGLRYLIIKKSEGQIETIHFDALVYANNLFTTVFDEWDENLLICDDVKKEEIWELKSRLQSLDLNEVQEKTKLK